MDRTERLSHAMRTLSWIEHATADEWVKGSGLTRQQARTLGYIEAEQERGVIAREITEMSGTTAASVASLLQGLERRNLIVRMPAPSDSRVKLLRVTEEGARLIDGFDTSMAAARERLYSSLTAAEQEQMLSMAETLVHGADPALLPPRDILR